MATKPVKIKSNVIGGMSGVKYEQLVDSYGRDAKTFLKEQFQDENCPECHKGCRSHTAVPFLGNWWGHRMP
jgi:hypothetical protein